MIIWDPVERITVDSVDYGSARVEVAGDNVYLCWQDFGSKSFFTGSTNGGVSWQEPLLLTDSFPPFYSNNRFAVSGNYVYFKTWYKNITPEGTSLGIWFLRSTDYGQTWDPGRVIGDWGREAWSIAAEENHVIINYEIRGQAAVEQGFAHSADYGETWEFFDDRLTGNHSPEIILRGGVLYETREGATNDAAEVLFSHSADYGKTWSPEIFISSTDSLVSDESYLSADSNGSVYVVWRDAKYGSSTGFGATIMLRLSTDYGNTWLNEQVITTIPTGGLPKVTVHENYLGIVWQNEVQEGEGIIFRTHCRVSIDGGMTWSQEYDVTENSSAANFNPFMAITEEYVHLSWGTYVNSVSQVFYRRGRLLKTGIDSSGKDLPTEFSLSGNYPNPFNNTTNIQFNISKRAYSVLELYNTLGQKVDKLIDGVLSPGEYDIRWNASRFDSGIYFAVLQVDRKIFLQKVVVMK